MRRRPRVRGARRLVARRTARFIARFGSRFATLFARLLAESTGSAREAGDECLELLAELIGLHLRHRLDEFHNLDLDAGPGDMGLVDSVEELPADADFEFRSLPSPGRKDIADMWRLLGLGWEGASRDSGEQGSDEN